MNWNINLTPAAGKDLNRLDKHVQGRVINKLKILHTESHPPGAKKISGSKKDWRIRIGDYRILYEIDHKANTITVWRIAHRKDAYR